MASRLFAPLLLGLLWLLSRLPLALLAPLGRALGGLIWWSVSSRRTVALRNLELCLPELSPAQRRDIAREHFALIGRSVLEHGLSWYASRERLMRLIHVEGDVQLAERSARSRPVVSVYMPATNATFEAIILRNRLRFERGKLFSRFESARALMRAVREGHCFFNLPDMDFGERDAAFVPFFGTPAATLLAPSRLARALDMVVQPVVATVLPGGQGYRVRFHEPLTDFPTDDALADTLRMNQWIEREVRQQPEQYLWVHKRFKTRPRGEPSLY
jgi:KDO2-lipid IV(A) lauroyltransferase